MEVKCKVVPLRSIEAHLGDRRYSSYSFLTPALEGGVWSASRPGRALPPGKEPPVPTVQEAGWAPEPAWTQRSEEKSSASVGDRTPEVQPEVRHCTDWATRLALQQYLFERKPTQVVSFYIVTLNTTPVYQTGIYRHLAFGSYYRQHVLTHTLCSHWNGFLNF
jgi:hypothetical protein